MRKLNDKDSDQKNSPYYIREKVELGKLAERFCASQLKIAMMVILVIYMYGAMCLKYASGAASFVTAISYIAYNDADMWTKEFPFDPYYLGIIIFGVLSLFFSFGNIENSKYLQLFTGNCC
jgi:branched-subunit amino acid transport protein AzlD